MNDAAPTSALNPLRATARLLQLASGDQSYRRAELDALLAAKPDLNIQNEKGEGLLHLALHNHQLKLFGQVLAAGADPNLQNHAGQSPMVRAIETGRLKEAAALIRAGARLNDYMPQENESLLDVVIKCERSCRHTLENKYYEPQGEEDVAIDKTLKASIDIMHKMAALLIGAGARLSLIHGSYDDCKYIHDIKNEINAKIDAVLSGQPVNVESIDAELLSGAAALGREAELLEPTIWDGHKDRLASIVSDVPLYLSEELLHHYPSLAASLLPDAHISAFGASMQGHASPQAAGHEK